MSIPVSVGGDDIVNLKLLSNFFNAQMKSVGLELLASHVGDDGGWQAHQAGSLVFGCFAPAVALLATSWSILFGAYK
jgi:hypothetical protein